MINNNTHIPAGYKSSELGVIPEGWQVKRLGELVSIASGVSPSLLNLMDDGKYPYIKVEDMNNCDKYQIFSRNYSNDENYIIDANSVIFPKRGAAILNNKVRICSVAIQMDSNMMSISPKKEINVEYLYYKLTSEQLFKIADTSTIPQINNKHILPYKITLPPLEEQERIAEILGTWDRAIELQGRKVALLQNRKRALMQQLLTPHRRLPNFSEPWKTTKLGEIGAISSAGVDKKIIEGEMPVRLLNFLDVYRRDFIYSHQLNHWVTAKKEKIEKCSIKKGDVFFTPSSETPNDIGLSAAAMEDMPKVVYSYHIVRLRLNINWDLNYRAYAFKTDEFFKQAEKVCDGSGQRYVISQPKFRQISITYPASIEEQRAIAEVLTTADREIELATQNLTALSSQKRALMQQLLTGKKQVTI